MWGVPWGFDPQGTPLLRAFEVPEMYAEQYVEWRSRRGRYAGWEPKDCENAE